MKVHVAICCALLFLLFATSASAADVSGKWKANAEGPMGAIEIEFNFQVSGDQLTGTVSDPMGGENKIQEGKLTGDELAFFVMAGDGQFKITYKGKLAGEDLKLTMSFGEGGEMPPMEMTAKRVK